MWGLFVLLLIAAALVSILASAALLYAILHPPRKTLAVVVGRDQPGEPSEMGYESSLVRLPVPGTEPSAGWLVRGGNERGPTVVVLPGFGDSRYGSLRRVPLLVEHSRQIVLLDMPGQGDHPLNCFYHSGREAPILAHMISNIDMPTGVVIHGTSVGSLCAVALAEHLTAQHDQPGVPRVLGLILESGYGRWTLPVPARLRELRLPVYPIWPIARGALWLWESSLRNMDRTRQLGSLDVPALVVHGQVDPIVPLSEPQRLAQACRNSELVELPELGHHGLYDAGGTLYRQALDRWFASLQPDVDQRGREH